MKVNAQIFSLFLTDVGCDAVLLFCNQKDDEEQRRFSRYYVAQMFHCGPENDLETLCECKSFSSEKGV